MQQIDIYKRLTHKFNLGWSHEDEWETAATVKVLPLKVISTTDDSYTVTHRVIAPSSHRKTDLSNAIASTMTRSGCRHEYDCCGCASHHATVRRVSAREYVAKVNVTYNY